MNKIRDLGLKVFFGFLLAFLIFHYNDSTVKATTTPSYVFQLGTATVKPDDNKEQAIVKETTNLFVKLAAGSAPAPLEARVKYESGNPSVVSIVGAADNRQIGEAVTLRRNGPGYATITATITDNSGTMVLTIALQVALEFHEAKMKQAGCEFVTVFQGDQHEKLLLELGTPQQVVLKYIDEPGGTVSGSAIELAGVDLKSSDPGIVRVEADGTIIPVGGGEATITAASPVSENNKQLTDTLIVVVKPSFTLNYDDVVTGQQTSKASVSRIGTSSVSGAAFNVPSNFHLDSNGSPANKLKWVVKDFSTGKIISEGDTGKTSKMEYRVSELDGTVSFYHVKAGTYEVFAFAGKNYSEQANAPYAYMKIVVPINLYSENIVMNVGDTYNLLENSNLPDTKVFGNPTYSNDMNIATLDTKTYVIKAKKKGTVSITLPYNTGSNLFDDKQEDDAQYSKTITVTVIDGIALSANSVNLYVGGTLKLDAITTEGLEDNSGVTWTSGNDKIASVEDGLVTAKGVGEVVITAQKTIDGVVKTATCKIYVKKSADKITVDPETLLLAIGENKDLLATVTPEDKKAVLQWKSSNEKIVKIMSARDLSVTIQGVSGGTAVISAIDKDNVVVGYCHVTVRQPVTKIELSEKEATVSLATKKFQLRATVTPDNAANKEIEWTSANTKVATVDKKTGMVTFVAPGNVSIIATSVDNPAVTAICNFNVQVPVATVTLDETTKTMYVGQTARLTYKLLPVDASINTVTWTSTNTSVAAVDGTGLVTAKGVGTAVIILKALDGGQSVYCTINVRRVASSVKFDVSTLKLKVGESYEIKTTFTPTDSTDTNLAWESSDTKVATVDDSGKITGKGAGSAIIVAKTEVGGTAYCNVTVTQPASGLILNFSEKTIYIGTKFMLEASVSPSSATNLNVTWKSSNEKIATVSKTGEVAGLQGGVAIITCTTVEGGYVATCVVTVRESVTTIKLDHETYYLGVGKSFQLTATVTTETATNQNVLWTSSNEAVATVTQKGKVTGIKNGYTTITAMALDGSEVEATCEVRVVNAVESITISSNYLSMYVGDTKKLKATIRPSNATFKTAGWTSSDTSVAIVDDNGTVTGLKAGSATITAQALDNSGKKVICQVVVYERVPSTGITLQDKSLTMVPGEEKIVRVVLIPATSTDGFTWSTDNPAVATVNRTTGRITARSTGKAYITVMTDSGKTATVEVTVIGLNMTSLTLEQYTTYPYPLEVEGATAPVKWSIDKPQVAVITNGQVSSRAVGTATITATVNGRRLTCKLTVTPIGKKS
ncbi:MAG TPA: hypothetical protein GXX75_10595 [Clostridiales bacterium]|nr:hypothetical protein [Clostridiales bacterium]